MSIEEAIKILSTFKAEDGKTNYFDCSINIEQINAIQVLICEVVRLQKMVKIEKEKIKKRSLNANNYAWVLMGEIAKVLNISSDEVYERMLKDYGTNLLDENDEIVMISSKSEIMSTRDLHIAFIGTGIVKDKVFNHYRVIKGSSQYDTKEMSIFINGIVQECKDLDIPTLEDEKINSLIKEWK